MIVTVTANTSLDHILFVPEFGLNQTIRASQVVQSMGGKPTDASWILGELQIPSLALGFAAGPVGAQIAAMLQQRGVTTDFIQVEGDSRRNIVIITENGTGQSTITDASLVVSSQHVAQLEDKYRQALSQATCIILGGTLPASMPPDFYANFIRLAHEQQVPTIFDASEPFLSAGLAACPTCVKPNRDELEQISGQSITTLAEAYQAGRNLQKRFGVNPIITLGDQGGLALLPDRAYHIPALPVEVVNTAGAGDGILAGLAAAIAQGQSIEEGLRLGFATATAILLTPGTADCHREDVLCLIDQIELLPWEREDDVI